MLEAMVAGETNAHLIAALEGPGQRGRLGLDGPEHEGNCIGRDREAMSFSTVLPAGGIAGATPPIGWEAESWIVGGSRRRHGTESRLTVT
jgi:hypothetical protein